MKCGRLPTSLILTQAVKVKYEEIEEVVGISKTGKQGETVTGPMLRQLAEEARLGLEDFKASEGWLSRLRLFLQCSHLEN